MNRLSYCRFIFYILCFLLYACTDDKEVFQADKGYVQFKVYKSESYVKNETSRASGNVLDSLYEANKVKVVMSKAQSMVCVVINWNCRPVNIQ